MTQHGVTLIEMVIVISIIGILTAIGMLSFTDFSRRTNINKQTRIIYTELSKARAHALNEGRSKTVKLRAGSFEVYSSASDDENGAQPQQTIPLKHSITCNKGIPVAISFDARGITNDECSICTADDSSSSGADSVIVSGTRLRLGKRSHGKECDDANIAVQ